MAFSRITHAGGNLGANGGTFSNGGGGMNTTGADLIILAVSFYVGNTPDTSNVSDNNGLTWNQRTARVTADTSVRFFYAYGAGSGRSGHTFSVSKVSSFMSVYVVALSGALTSGNPADQENGGIGGNTSTTVSTGSITPTEGNEYVIAAVASTATGDSMSSTNMSLLGQVNYNPGAAYAIAVADEIQTSATARSETFNWTGAYYSAGAIDSFKSAAGGGGAGGGQPTTKRWGGASHMGTQKVRGGHRGGPWGWLKEAA